MNSFLSDNKNKLETRAEITEWYREKESWLSKDTGNK